MSVVGKLASIWLLSFVYFIAPAEAQSDGGNFIADVDSDAADCPSDPDCPFPAENFYTADGSCNNPLDGATGQAGRPHKRLVSAAYSDGEGLSRRSSNTDEVLPSAREVSVRMQNTKTQKSTKHTHILVIWGQFLSHDLVLTPDIEREGLNCANCEVDDSACFNIPIPEGDEIIGESGRECLPLSRSKPISEGCINSNQREQVNDLTPFIDGGTVYGNSDSQFRDLLDSSSAIGKLKVGKTTPDGYPKLNTPYLPSEDEAGFHVACPADVHKPSNFSCFAAGDIRVNENSALVSFHTLFFRFHNALVEQLSGINPHWNRDTLIQNARMIVSAVTQRITYNEFLPEILGEDYVRRFQLEVLDQGYWSGYDPTFDATTSNAFATAAMRFGHTLLTSPLTRPSPIYGEQGRPMKLKNLFFNSIPLFQSNRGGANSLLRGLTSDAAETADTTMVEDIHKFLFAPSGQMGQDLLSRNIQRGRDHGLPGYNVYREFCGLKRGVNFSDFDEIEASVRQKLLDIYIRVDDVDLYIGGLAETAVDGGLLGPTFSCILGYQFRDIRKGDRLWHEKTRLFKPAQLQSIREFDLSALLCQLDDMVEVQPKPFQQISVSGNGRKPCPTQGNLNLQPWREGSSFGDNAGTNYEMTAWFPTAYVGYGVFSSHSLLNFLLSKRQEDVCKRPLKIEGRNVNGRKQLRYKCPSGSISETDYPNVDASKGEWKAWENYSSTLQKTLTFSELQNQVFKKCQKPIALQVFTTSGIPARQTGDVFAVFSPTFGFVCRDSDQPDGKCKDYQTRFFCQECMPYFNDEGTFKVSHESDQICSSAFSVLYAAATFSKKKSFYIQLFILYEFVSTVTN